MMTDKEYDNNNNNNNLVTTMKEIMLNDDDNEEEEEDVGSTNGQYYHTSIVLFYKYFINIIDYNINNIENNDNNTSFVECIEKFCKELCNKLNLKGRILIANEGVNGTVSAYNVNILNKFINEMENFQYIFENNNNTSIKLFNNVDWKISSVFSNNNNNNNNQEKEIEKDNTTTTTTNNNIIEPFPDMKISIVNEIISTGKTVSVQDVKENGAKHLSPTQFHEMIQNNNPNDIVLIDVRNSYEYNIGHFINPNTNQSAINPETNVFSTFDTTFCTKHSNDFKNKQVLMYCTGGIRCEKASVMIKKYCNNNNNVYQLSGGIHRYLETYGTNGYFHGKNFVFDQRITQTPSECYINNNQNTSSSTISKAQEQERQQLKENGKKENKNNTDNEIVGQCIECSVPYDVLCGSRICTVCRDLVLVCPTCQQSLREYHCTKHAAWKKCYYTFINIFTINELQYQKEQLIQYHQQTDKYQRNIRKTLSKQIRKVTQRIEELQSGNVVQPDDPNTTPRYCRTCMEPLNVICDGKCWGFWKQSHNINKDIIIEPIKEIHINDRVEPGPNWNVYRLGSKFIINNDNNNNDTGKDSNNDDTTSTQQQTLLLRQGTVVEMKTWGSGNTKEVDCVAVRWDDDDDDHGKGKHYQPLIYRWGIIVLNGTRVYDVQRI